MPSRSERVGGGAGVAPAVEERNAYLVGGGIASLASAAYLIRDAGLAGRQIHVFEELDALGGSLDGEGTPQSGYVIRGGRMFTDEAYTCTNDLLSFIPSLQNPGESVRDEMRAFNARVRSHSRSRLVRAGEKVDVSTFGLSNQDRLDLLQLMTQSEESLGTKRIEDHFQPSFFTTNFWYMWATTFAFQPWHSVAECRRYVLRFIQEVPRFATLGGVKRTPYNQYDAIVLPLTTWLKQQGVQFRVNCQVTGLDFQRGASGKRVERLRYSDGDSESTAALAEGDVVFVTNGSMTAASSLGSMTSPPRVDPKEVNRSSRLWKSIAAGNSDFGKPEVFFGNVDESKWLSFTATLHDPTFFALMEAFTGNVAGTGGLVTFIDSNWLMSVVLPHQPHFLNQPAGVNVFWGYGLFPEAQGNYVDKPMSECTGAEILVELWRHLRFDDHLPRMLESANCIPCMMPFITSQFMPRARGDRPLVRPTGTTNLAFIGQYCEIPDDVVFTVEYSVRSAQTAVYSLFGVDKRVSPLYKGQHDVGVLLNAMKTMLQ